MWDFYSELTNLKGAFLRSLKVGGGLRLVVPAKWGFLRSAVYNPK